jgi:NAD-dependent DNA ligase
MLVYGADGKLQIAYSRGDGEEGADITRHASKIHNIPKSINTDKVVVIRAENIISPASFAKVNTGKFARAGRIYKNPRNMVSGLMNSSENHPEVYKAIDTVVYEIVGSTMGKGYQLDQLEAWGFTVVDYVYGQAEKWDDTKLTKLLNDRRANSKYELDGQVIEVDSAKVRARMATDDLNPEYAVKFKVADASNLAIATVRNVEWNLSKDGYYKPRVQILPVDLVGVTITNLTGFNAKFIKESGIGPGALIKITRSGDVIPFILETVKPVAPQMPDDTTATWTDTGVDLIVADASSNDTVKFERLNDFFASIDVPGLGEGNLREMFDMGFDVPEKIIPLSQEDISNLVGSRVIGKKIFTAMRTRFTNIPLYELMGAHASFGRGIGVRKMKKLYEAFHGDMTKCASVVAVMQVEGFEQKSAAKVAAGYPVFMEFYGWIKDFVTIKTFEAKKVGNLTGKDVVITGFRDKTLDTKIEELGGRVASGVSSKTHLVVAADPADSSTKLKKARELGIPIMTKDEFLASL